MNHGRFRRHSIRPPKRNSLCHKSDFRAFLPIRLHRGRRRGFKRTSSGSLHADWFQGHPPTTLEQELHMTWTKPEAEVVAVTMEVTAYVATL